MTDRATEIAREACARRFDENGSHFTANRFREGLRDDCPYMAVARIAAELALFVPVFAEGIHTLELPVRFVDAPPPAKARLRAHIDGRKG